MVEWSSWPIRLIWDEHGNIWDAVEYERQRQATVVDDWEANLWALTTIVEPWEAHIYGFRSHLV